MGQDSDFVGQIGIEPELTEHQLDDLTIMCADGAWSPCEDGCCLAFEGAADEGELAATLRDLVRTFAKPRGLRLNGMIVGSEPDTKALFAVQVKSNRVSARNLWPGREASPPPKSRARGRVSPGRTAQVIDLATRRTGRR